MEFARAEDGAEVEAVPRLFSGWRADVLGCDLLRLRRGELRLGWDVHRNCLSIE